MVTVNTQQISAIARQVAAIAAIVLGCLTAIPMPAWVHPILVAAGTIILAIEHYVGDPSTGNTPAPAPIVKPVTSTTTTV